MSNTLIEYLRAALDEADTNDPAARAQALQKARAFVTGIEATLNQPFIHMGHNTVIGSIGAIIGGTSRSVDADGDVVYGRRIRGDKHERG